MTDDGRNRLDPMETASRDEIAAVQIERLRATLQHAHDNIPHYGSRFDDAGLAPADLESLEDLCAFPFTVKEDLRRNFPFGMFAVPRERVMRIHASSGTTGTPTVVGYTRADLDMWADVMARSMRAAGVRSGDLVQISYATACSPAASASTAAPNASVAPWCPSRAALPRARCGSSSSSGPGHHRHPSYMLALADEFARQGLDPRQSSLQIGMSRRAVDRIDAQRDRIPLRHAGARRLRPLEVIGPGVSAECAESKDGLHIWEDHFYPEIIDRRAAKRCPTARSASS